MKGVKRSSAGEDEVWLYLYGRDEAGYSDWQRAFVDPGLMSKSTWLHHKLALEKEGKVKKKLSEKTRSPVYYVDVDKREELQALAKRTEFFSKLEKLTPKVQLELIDKLSKERDRFKRLNRIHELEDYPLPARAVLKKLLELDYKITDFFSKKDLTDNDLKETIENPFREHFVIPNHMLNVYALGDLAGELADTKNIEVKLVSPEEYSPVTWLISQKYEDGWLPLVDKPIRGAGIIGAWKELLALYKDDFEDKWLQWKEKYELSKEDWEIVGLSVREMMEHDCIPLEIHNFLYEYLEYKKR